MSGFDPTLDPKPVQVPLHWSWLAAYQGEVRAQFSDTTLYGSDLFAVGGPYTVRGFDSDRALLGKQGWFVKNDLTLKGPLPFLQPYLFADIGQVSTQGQLLVGAGTGMRAFWRGFRLDAFRSAVAYAGPALHPELGFSLGYSF
jgi:hemolysin activation/secretion protein